MSPAQRLEASRARLRSALQSARGPKPGSRDDDEPGAEGSLLDGLLRSGRRVWARHPVRSALRFVQQMVGPAVIAELKPQVREHPWRVVAIAAGVGAAFVWLRPWRLLPHAALGSALLSFALPRRAIFQELMSSGLVERLASGELFTRWFGQAEPDERRDEPAGTAPPEAPTPSGAEVLHPAEPVADAARAA